ncbi:metallophosphoesterase [Fervidicella metallireducens]|uniref:metallophosphoesterase n=1 Tax=Fervidicella metallireducens TaxID=655338 RepID=UPI0005564420|nr:metallophosphoesterase [Fervidicella metallireducens]
MKAKVTKISFYKKLLNIFIFLGVILLFCYFQNNSIVINRITLEFKNLPDEFNGYKIIHISDLHSKYFGKKQERILKKIYKENPDIVVVTGDLIDSRVKKEEPCIILMEELTKKFPVYFVTGNHEIGCGKTSEFIEKLKKAGVRVLRNEAEYVYKGKNSISIIGIDDSLVNYLSYFRESEKIDYEIKKSLDKLDKNSFKILLSHRPEKIGVYADNNMDLIFSGHAHGGQFRLPFIGGIFAPGQGFFPKYTSGAVKIRNSTMVISRGLGNSLMPLRIFNRPEIVTVTLMKLN